MRLCAQSSGAVRIAVVTAAAALAAGCGDRPSSPSRWAATNGPLHIEVSWPTNRFGAGEPAEVRLRVAHPAGAALEVAEPVGASRQVLVLDRWTRPVRRRGDREEREWIWRVTSFEFGRHVLWTGAPAALAVEPGRPPLPPCPAAIDVESVRGETDTDWRPPKGPARWPAGVPRWLWALPLVAILAALLGWLTARRRRPRPPPGPPPPPPDRIAREALERLRASGAIEAGQADYFHVELSRIVREYIEARFGLHAPERTTEEFLREAAASGVLAPTHQVRLRDLLEACDLVKFARACPGADDMRAALEAAVRFVADTAPPTAAPETAP